MARCGYCGSEDILPNMACNECEKLVHTDCLEEIVSIGKCPTYACEGITFVDKGGVTKYIREPLHSSSLCSRTAIVVLLAAAGITAYGIGRSKYSEDNHPPLTSPPKTRTSYQQMVIGVESLSDGSHKFYVTFGPAPRPIGPLRPDGTF